MTHSKGQYKIYWHWGRICLPYNSLSFVEISWPSSHIVPIKMITGVNISLLLHNQPLIQNYTHQELQIVRCHLEPKCTLHTWARCINEAQKIDVCQWSQSSKIKMNIWKPWAHELLGRYQHCLGELEIKCSIPVVYSGNTLDNFSFIVLRRKEVKRYI
jgi:hypothetical protein